MKETKRAREQRLRGTITLSLSTYLFISLSGSPPLFFCSVFLRQSIFLCLSFCAALCVTVCLLLCLAVLLHLCPNRCLSLGLSLSLWLCLSPCISLLMFLLLPLSVCVSIIVRHFLSLSMFLPCHRDRDTHSEKNGEEATRGMDQQIKAGVESDRVTRKTERQREKQIERETSRERERESDTK